jgi:hypothetical protein
LAFALAGTIVSAVIIASIAYGFAQLVPGIECDFLELVTCPVLRFDVKVRNVGRHNVENNENVESM